MNLIEVGKQPRDVTTHQDEHGSFAATAQVPTTSRNSGNVRITFPDMLLRSYDWTSKVSEISIHLAELDEYRFSCLFHMVIDTPVAAAQDHPKWNNDVVLVFTLYTTSGAFITSITHMFRRGCGHYLRELSNDFQCPISWPIRNLSSVTLGGTFRLQVTAC